MADNYTFKDANRATTIRASKQFPDGSHANQDIEFWENGTFAWTCDIANSQTIDVTDAGVILMPANLNRKGMIIQNRSEHVSFFVKYGESPAVDDAVLTIEPWAYWEMPYPIYRGIVTAISLQGSVSTYVTELL